jgi:ferredoxin
MGRMICAFVCPFGLLQDAMYKIPSPKWKMPRWTGYLRYAALGLLVLLFPLILGFEQEGYLRIDKVVATPTPSEADPEKMELEIVMTATNLGKKPLSDPALDVLLHKKPEVEGDPPGEKVGTIKHAYKEVEVPPGETLELPAFRIPDTSAEQFIFFDFPGSRAVQNPRYDLYYCSLCPAAGLTATTPKMFMDTEISWGKKLSDNALKLGITVFFLVFMIVVSRPFCRTFCPLGAIYSLTAPLSLMGMKLEESKCDDCGECRQVCHVDLNPVTDLGSRDCTLCGDCKRACPNKAISRTFGLRRSPPKPIQGPAQG